jgi:hypothetical protein
MAAKLSPQDLLAAAAELPADERRAFAAALRPSDVPEADEDAVAEIVMGSAVRMLNSSREVLDGVLESAARVNAELERGWF